MISAKLLVFYDNQEHTWSPDLADKLWLRVKKEIKVI